MSSDTTAKVAARFAAAKEHKGEGQEFYELLDKEWNSVKYDPETRKGWANAGSLGRIEFQESGSDPAVIVRTESLRFKSNPKTMMKILEALKKAINMSD